MRLDPQEVERFYAIWLPLIRFVKQRLQLPQEIPADAAPGSWIPANVWPIRNALWENDSVREAFIAENPAGLSADDLAIVKSWQHRREGKFVVLRHLKKHSILLENSTAYAVLGLASPISEVVSFTPCFVETVLLPFGDRIIYDSLMSAYNVTLGRGIRTGLEQTYADAKERGAIITSLLPAKPASREEQQEADLSTNAKVLDAFRKHLYRSGLSTKVVERDVGNVTAFAKEYLLGLPKPRSLRECNSDDVAGYVSQVQASPTLKEARRRETLTSLKRFVKFLRDTERLDYFEAQDALDLLKGQ